MIVVTITGFIVTGIVCYGLGAFTVLAVQKKKRKAKQG